MAWMLALALLPQENPGLDALAKIETRIRTAKALRVSFTWSQEVSYPKVVFKTRATGGLLIREGGRIRVSEEQISDGNASSLLLICDGTTLWGSNTWMGRTERARKKGPASLLSLISTQLATGGAASMAQQLWLMLDKEVDAEAMRGWNPSTCDFRGVQDDGDAKLLLYGFRKPVPGDVDEILLRYDPRTWRLLSRRLTSARGAAETRETRTYTESFADFSFDVEIPDDRFVLPE